MDKVERLKLKWQLLPHPEGGFYRETYRSDEMVNLERGQRAASTAIVFLLFEGVFSAFHRIQSDEVWHYYEGEGVRIYELMDGGVRITELRLGGKVQHVVKRGVWFASEPLGAFGFVGCTVAPGFEFADFEMGEREVLIRDHPGCEDVIRRLTRS